MGLVLWDSASAASTGATVAKSAVVATTFFAPPVQTGVLAWLGLATPAAAVTPVGWVFAAAVAAGGGYYGVTRWWASQPDTFVDVVPRFINSPIDTLGASLFDLAAGLAVRVAAVDGEITASERAAIIEHFIMDWGFDPAFVQAALPLVERDMDGERLQEAASAVTRFLLTEKDCNADAIQREFLDFLRDLMMADGRADPAEQAAIAAIEQIFATAHTRWSIEKFSAEMKEAATTAASAATDASRGLAAMSSTVAAAAQRATAGWSRRFR